MYSLSVGSVYTVVMCVYGSYIIRGMCVCVPLCRRLTMQDLEEAAEEEVGKESTRTSFRRQDSDAARMYN